MDCLGGGYAESVRDLRSSYRALFAVDVLGTVVLINLYMLGTVEVHETWPFWLGMCFWLLSAVATIGLFFLIAPKLCPHEEEDGIYQPSIVASSAVGLWSFLFGYIGIVIGVAS